MNRALFKATAKANWLLGVIFILLLCMYMGSILSLYHPDSAEEMQELLKLLPEEMAKAMGIQGTPTDLAGFLGSYFYGMLVFLFPLVYVSLLGYRLMARLVDGGSMAYLLSTPNTRGKIALTQGLYFLASLVVLFLALTAAALGMAQAMYPGRMDVAAFVRLNLCAFLLTCAVSSVTWFFSCLMNDARFAVALGTGIPVALFMGNVLFGMAEGLEKAAGFTLYGLFRAPEILSGNASVMGLCLLYGVITLVLYAGGIVAFQKKDMSL